VSSPDPTPIDVAAFARTVGSTPDDQLAQGMSGEYRGVILDEIFGRAATHVNADRVGDDEAVVHFRLTGAAGGGDPDFYELVLADGNCTVNRQATADPKLVVTVDAVDFLKLVTGNASGPALFLQGRLKAKGNLLWGTKLPSLFALPRPE
jgi:putative sterol carrier protein